MFSSTDLIILLIWVIVACKLCYLGLVCVPEALGYFVFVNSTTFFIISEIMKFLLDFFFLSKHTKHPGL